MTRTDLQAYVANLEPEAQKMFALAESIWYAKADYDTLCEEFQIAVNVMELFQTRAAASAGAGEDHPP